MNNEIIKVIERYCMGITPTDNQLMEITDVAASYNCDMNDVLNLIENYKNGPTREELDAQIRLQKEREEQEKREREERIRKEEEQRRLEAEKRRKAEEEAARVQRAREIEARESELRARKEQEKKQKLEEEKLRAEKERISKRKKMFLWIVIALTIVTLIIIYIVNPQLLFLIVRRIVGIAIIFALMIGFFWFLNKIEG